ncbi:Peroxisome chaperone and import receptor [Pichia californica]|uniref:Peroxisome chaperone and import receptor n=1 Tax=Pichia californica TaxID=460514 RepID=A0A9P7BF40_9ASCO|nr:Peroxisome chaperone and import receptor [[Candida] californica]KAG0686958.1 Peroxisome chaperone and import receptor [[Candida] californica]
MSDDLDDFDDLDDYLDDFDEEILSQEPGATIKKDENLIESNENSNNNDIINSGLDPQFNKQLENFMNMLDPNGDGNTLNSLLDKSNNNNNNNNEIEFKQSINETINRIKSSSKQVDDESTKKMDNDEELLTTLLNSLDIDGNDNEGFEGFQELKELLGNDNKNNSESDGDKVDKLTNVVMKMLNRLTSKEMMYDSVNSAVQNYKEFFKENNSITIGNDYERFKQQLKHLENVKNKFDDSAYNEDDEKTRDFIDQEMESFNKLLPPPTGVIQDNLGELGLDNVKWNDNEVPDDLEGCVQQ